MVLNMKIFEQKRAHVGTTLDNANNLRGNIMQFFASKNIDANETFNFLPTFC